MMTEPIDAVVTWVDGSDEAHFRRRQAAMQQANLNSLKYIPAGYGERRFTNNGEIRYCLYSIRKFIPWIRHIFLVTDNQVPTFLDEETKRTLGVSIVDHSVIFRDHEYALPTFNSVSIGSMLYRIPGLAEKYIYFNDDCIVIDKVELEDFFREGKVVLRGRWEKMEHFGAARTVVSGILNKTYHLLSLRYRSMYVLQQIRAAKLAGLSKRYLKSAHVPHPINTATLRNFFDRNPEILSRNIRHRFRHMDQFVAHPLAHYLEIKNENYVLQHDNDHITIRFYNKADSEEKVESLSATPYKFICLQSMEYANRETRDRLIEALGNRIFGPANFG